MDRLRPDSPLSISSTESDDTTQSTQTKSSVKSVIICHRQTVINNKYAQQNPDKRMDELKSALEKSGTKVFEGENPLAVARHIGFGDGGFFL